MAKAVGIGGVFFKSPDPAKLSAWYEQWLGVPFRGESSAIFDPREMPSKAFTVWAAFDQSTDYFAPSSQPFMFNIVVDDLEGALQQVAAGGAVRVGGIKEFDYGSFGWFMDPDGNKVELWQPPS